MKYGLNAASRLYSALAISGLLAACGSGGGSGSSQPAAPSDTVRIACQVSNAATGSPVAGATVNYQTSDTAGTNKAYTTTTNPDGSCTLDLPASEVAGVTFPAASVTATGFEPQTILCLTPLQGGQTCNQNVGLIPLAANVSIPEGGDVVMHVGDDRFGGTINSQFQKKPDGAELNFKINDWDKQVGKAGITKATVVLDAKGWQTTIAPGCKNVIELVGDAGQKMTLPGGDSSANGMWSGGHQAPFVFEVAQVGTVSATLRIAAGTCGTSTDLDDFETNRIRVYYCGGAGNCIP